MYIMRLNLMLNVNSSIVLILSAVILYRQFSSEGPLSSSRSQKYIPNPWGPLKSNLLHGIKVNRWLWTECKVLSSLNNRTLTPVSAAVIIYSEILLISFVYSQQAFFMAGGSQVVLNLLLVLSIFNETAVLAQDDGHYEPVELLPVIQEMVEFFQPGNITTEDVRFLVYNDPK